MTDTRGQRVYITKPRLRFQLYKAASLIQGVTPGTLMYDSTNLFDIPTSAKAVASYLTGFPQSAAAWARFAGKLEVTIVQHPGIYGEGDVLDVESGAAGFSDVHPFIATRKSQGLFRPTVYCSVSNVSGIRSASREFVLGTDYDLWVAGWTGAPHIGYPGAAATQYASYQNYDLSVIHDGGWPHRKAVTPPPPPPPPPSPKPPTVVLRAGDKGGNVMLLQGHLNRHLTVGETKLVVDGDFGPLTLAAVKDFQADFHLVVDGIVGPHTWAALYA